MAEWLCFSSAETRERNEHLRGEPVESIYVRHGKGLIARGDVIYCLGMEDEELQLITRVQAASLDDDPEHEDSVIARDEEGADVDVDFDRDVPPEVARAIEYLHTDGSKHRLPLLAVRIDPSPFQGLASVRELSEGSRELDSLL